MNIFRRFLAHTVTHVSFAFLAMGGWAVFANLGHPFPEPLIAGLVQGILSGTITLVMKKALEALSRRFSDNGKGMLPLFAPPLIVCSVSLAVLVTSHLAAGTPEIVKTIAIPFSVAFTYACIYSFGLWRKTETRT
tara:strand:- start:2246 stop:2650 length:405 start_codon:yes stop_codon:yes gene_type:complete